MNGHGTVLVGEERRGAVGVVWPDARAAMPCLNDVCGPNRTGDGNGDAAVVEVGVETTVEEEDALGAAAPKTLSEVAGDEVEFGTANGGGRRGPPPIP